jgi:hypothetical protein
VTVRKILPFALLVVVASCGGSSESAQFSASERDEYNERANETNDAWKKFRVASNGCSTAAHASSCFETALESSGFAQALGRLRSTVVEFEFKPDPGDCRSSLDFLNNALSILEGDLDAVSSGDDLRAVATAPDVRRDWEGVAQAAALAAGACS